MRHFSSLAALALLVAGCEQDLSISKTPVVPGADSDTDAVIDTDPIPVDPAPEIEVFPSELDFGAWLEDCDSTPESIFVRNLGDADLVVDQIAILGDGRSSFSLDGAEPVTIPAGEEVEVLVVFTPVDTQVYDPYVAIRSNDADEAVSRVGIAGEGAAVAMHEDTFVQNPAESVDVLFSIDNSGSMSSDIANLGNSFDTFINSFVSLGLDYHIAVMTADPDCPEFLGPVISNTTPDPVAEFIRQTQAGTCSGEAAFGATKNALQPAMLSGTNSGFLRAASNLAVVALSDEPEQSERPGSFFPCAPPLFGNACMSVGSYVNFLVNLKGDPAKVTFSGIVAPRNASIISSIAGCDIAQPATRYHDAINSTGGVFGDLCQLDLNPFLTHLSLTAAGLDTRFTLTRVPTSTQAADFVVEVGGVQINPGLPNGYTYDPSTETIELHGTAIPESGQAVVVRYEAEGACD